MKQLHPAAKWKITTIGIQVDEARRLFDDASRGFLKQLAIIATVLISAMIVTVPVYADYGSEQPQKKAEKRNLLDKRYVPVV